MKLSKLTRLKYFFNLDNMNALKNTFKFNFIN